MDKMGIIILMTRNKTYEQKGQWQIDIVEWDEKHAYTLCVASTPAGDILPFQQVWSGKTKQSLPNAQAVEYEEANELGFDFTFADSPKKMSHYSTFTLMKKVHCGHQFDNLICLIF